MLGCAVAGCVTETVGSTPFKQPTKEDLDSAVATYVQIAYQRLENGSYEDAMKDIQRALALKPDSPLANTALAVAYQYQGEIDKSRNAYKKALGEDDKFSPAHLNYGNLLFQQKEFREACKQFEIAASDDFYNMRAAAFHSLGVCLGELGDLVGSETAFKRSLAVDGKYAPALLELAEMRYTQQRFPESKELFDKAVQVERDAARPLAAKAVWLGIRLARKFDNADAEASYVLFLKNTYPYSQEYLEYKKSLNP